jgi:ADP-heptose:LPS heptosyltransferase/lipopolysaccharide biosynthesis glycosyltransferase
MKYNKKTLAFIIATSGNETFMAGNVCIGINNNYVGEYEIIVLYKNTKEQDIAALKKIPNVRAIHFAFEEEFENKVRENAYIGSKVRGEDSIMAFAHYEIFKELSNFNKIVWFDTDILINKNINELIKDKSSFTATTDKGWTVGENFNKEIQGYDMISDGLCSAVLVVDDTLPHEEMYDWCYNKTVELAQSLFNRDQGIINLATQHFKINVNIVDADTWQCMPWHENSKEAIIVHFGGGNKIYDDESLFKKYPRWGEFHKQWLDYGGSDFIPKKSARELENSLFEVAYRKKFLELENNRVDQVLQEAKEKSKIESNSFLQKKTFELEDVNDVENEWTLPRNRLITALSHLCRDKDQDRKEVIESIASKQQRIQVAMVFGGGLGDALKPMAVVPELVKKLNCDITLVTDQKAAYDIKEVNPYISNVIYDKDNPYKFAEQFLKHAEIFDIIIFCRYTLTYYISPRSQIAPDIIKSILLKSEESKNQYDKYNFSNLGWPSMNNALFRELQKTNDNVTTITAKTSGLEINKRVHGKIPFYLKNQKSEILAPILALKYVTVHCGFDQKKLPDKSKKTSYDCTKNISIEKWEKIVASIGRLGVKVIQLGTENERRIDNVNLYLNGKTSLEQTALILKKSLCHIDTEGGLVHLANAVHTRSVVMFGPTPVGMFGYPDNINLEPHGCKECYWTTQSWVLECPRNTLWPDCMNEHKPETIYNAVSNVIFNQRQQGAKILKKDYSLNGLTSLIKQYGDKIHAEPVSILIVGNSKTVSKLRKELLDINAKITYNVVVESDFIEPDLISSNVEYGSFINLRYAGESFDLVACISEHWSEYSSFLILEEMMRVLKGPGTLIAASSAENNPITNINNITKSNKVIIIGNEELNDDTRLLVISKKPYKSCSKTLIPLRWQDDACHNPLTKSDQLVDLFGDISVMHESVNERLDAALAHHKEYLDAENKNWEISDKIIHNDFLTKEWISVGKDSVEKYGNKFLLDNWYEPEEWGTWGQGTMHSLLLPINFSSVDKGGIELQADLQIRFSKIFKKRTLKITIDEDIVGHSEIRYCSGRDRFEMTAFITRSEIRERKYILVNIEIDSTYIPAHHEVQSRDFRNLGIGLRGFRYRINSNISGSSNQILIKSV